MYLLYLSVSWFRICFLFNFFKLCCHENDEMLQLKTIIPVALYMLYIPVMAAVAVRKKVVSIGHFSPSFCFQLLQILLFVRLIQEQLSISNALKIRKE